MKKSIIYSTALAATLLAGTTGIVAINNTTVNAVENNDFTATTTNDFATKKIANTKDEMVYVMADASGAVKTKFIGNTIYNGEESLPFEMKVKYYLNGAEIAANEIANKSGHVKIVYTYNSIARYQGTNIPFLAITGMTLDGAKFNNVKLTNGKVVSEGEKYIIAGYALVGVNEALGTDLLPSEFSVEADVEDFELGTTYTILMNDLFTEIDTSKLANIDGLVNSVNKLADGVNTIMDGASKMGAGINEAYAGAKKLHVGANELAGGINTAATGAVQVAGGLDQITENNVSLQAGADAMIATTLSQVNAATGAMGVTVTADNFETVLPQVITGVGGAETETGAKLTQAYQTIRFAAGVKAYTGYVANAAAGANDLAAGLEMIDAKTPELVAGLESLENGLGELSAGAGQLNDGLATFKTSGVDKLVNFANKDLKNFSYNARKLVTAAANYKSYGDRNAETVKFVVKTASI